MFFGIVTAISPFSVRLDNHVRLRFATCTVACKFRNRGFCLSDCLPPVLIRMIRNHDCKSIYTHLYTDTDTCGRIYRDTYTEIPVCMKTYIPVYTSGCMSYAIRLDNRVRLCGSLLHEGSGFWCFIPDSRNFHRPLSADNLQSRLQNHLYTPIHGYRYLWSYLWRHGCRNIFR